MKPKEILEADSGENECQEERKEREYPAAYRLLRTDLLTNRMCKSFLDRVVIHPEQKVEVRFKFGKVKWLQVAG